MITDKALYKARALAFWEKHGLKAALDAFKAKRRTLFLWKKQFNEGGRTIHALAEGSKTPKRKRVRQWPEEIIAEIKRLRFIHPNLGKDKLYPELKLFCQQQNLRCPKPITISRIIKDLGGLRMFPQKVNFLGLVKERKKYKKMRKPKGFKALYPGHCVALDTIEKRLLGNIRRYVITFEDLHTRYCFAWSTVSHASLAAQEFFNLCLKVFPFPITFVLTDNGSEFAKCFAQELRRLHLTHYHTYPRTPKMNAHCERFNRTLQEEFMNYHIPELKDPKIFNRHLMGYLLWYNTRRVHHAFKNQLSPVQYMSSIPITRLPEECKQGWAHTKA
jgi:transposase InsO family protein